MREDQREEAQMELDEDMKYFRLAGRRKVKGRRDESVLRRIRQSLGIPVDRIAEEMKVCRSVVGRLEESEERRTISLKALERAAAALGCKVVYGIVPVSGEKMLEIGDRLRWKRIMREKHSGQ